MKNCSEKNDMIDRFDRDVVIMVIHPRKYVTDSENRPFLTLFHRRRNIQSSGGRAFFETSERNYLHGVEETGVALGKSVRQCGGIT